jgi:sterol desaturase/sphingolipid hydroxylase (fatty acid hydroxylase superfamily)
MIKDYVASLLGPEPASAVLVAALIGASILYFLVRYFLIAGAGWGAVEALRRLVPSRRLQPTPFTREQVRREIGYSAFTSVVFALVTTAVFFAKQAGLTQVYTEIRSYGWAWFWLSIPTMLLVHDFYFYWMHRVIHSDALFERVHRTHHLSTNPSPFAAFAFHPLEAVAEAGIIPIIAFLIPVHPMALAIFAMLSLIYNVYGHLGYEVMPRWLAKTPAGALLNKSAYHNNHHRAFRSNYGLYTVIWDRLFGTFDPRSEGLYDRATLVAAVRRPQPAE